MLYFATTLGELRDAVDAYIERLGEHAPVGIERPKCPFDNLVNLEWVCVDATLTEIVGSEAQDTELNLAPGQVNAIRIS